MKKEYADKWADALESGKYNQTDSWLKDSRGFCCLGVLCDIVKNELKTDWDDDNSLLGQLTILPKEVVKLTGIKTNTDPWIVDEGENQHFSVMNDDLGYTFVDIAKTIRANWKDL